MTERPELKILQFVQDPLASPTLAMLPELAAAHWNPGITVDVLMGEITSGACWVWHIGDERPGLALLRIEQGPSHKTLVLDGLAGHNVVGRAQAIGDDLKTIARVYECQSIECLSSDPRWQAVAKRLGFAPVSTVYSMKVG